MSCCHLERGQRHDTSTTVLKCRISPRADESGRCSGSNRRGKRSVSYPPTAVSITTFNSTAIALPPTSTVPLAMPPFALGVKRPEPCTPHETPASLRPSPASLSLT